jgi:hypothetical protein
MNLMTQPGAAMRGFMCLLLASAWLMGQPATAAAQQIERIEMERVVGQDRAATFTLTIHGDGFSTQADDVTVSVLPGKGIIKPATVAAAAPKVITATFVADAAYAPGIVSVASITGGHDSFRLPAISRAVLLAPQGSNKPLETFRLRIEGSGFIDNMTKVLLSPPPNVQPTVDRITEKGTIVEASFIAASGYRPSGLSVSVGSGDAIQYKVPDNGTPDTSERFVFVYRSVLPPKVVSDMFGKRIAKRFLAFQVIITNRNRTYDWLIHDLTLDLTRVRQRWNDPGQLVSRMKQGGVLVSSTELELMRGVAEKGRTFDPRNLTFHILQGTGVVAGGLIGIVNFGAKFADYVGVFNGPFLAAYEGIAPDHAVSNLNRLNDSAFAPNTLITKRQARRFVLFVPQDLFLTKQEQRRLWDAPTELFADTNADLDLRLAEIQADGIFIAEADEVTGISLTQIDIAVAERKKAQQDKPEIHGVVVGRNLQNAQLQIVAPAGVTLTPDGSTGDTRLPFILRANAPLDPSATIQVEVSKGPSHGTVSLRLDYVPDKPVVTDVKPAAPVITGAAAVQAEVLGTGFIPGVTTLRVAGDNVTLSDVVVQSGTRITANVKAEANAAIGNRDVVATNPPAAPSQPKPLLIKPPAPTVKNPKPPSGKISETVAIELTGTNFVSGATKVSIVPDSGVTITVGEVTATVVKATIAIGADAAAGASEITVTTPGGEAKVKFTISK